MLLLHFLSRTNMEEKRMNIYIGDSFESGVFDGEDVMFDDELLNFVYKVSKKTGYDMSKLYSIDPYGDTVISKADLPRIIEICEDILSYDLLEGYKKYDEAKETIKGLHMMGQEALQKGKGLVVSGD